MKFKKGDIVRNKLKENGLFFEIDSILRPYPGTKFAKCFILDSKKNRIESERGKYNTRERVTGVAYEECLIRCINLNLA